MSPTSGGGIGTPVPLIPCNGSPCEDTILHSIQLGLTLDRYQELMRLAPAAFNGLYKSDEAGCYDCAAVWKQTDRDAMAIVIAQAEEMRERELQYYTSPKYKLESLDFIYNTMLYFLTMKHLIKVGTYKTSDISIGAPIVLNPLSDPITFAVVTTVTDPTEICVYHPGSSIPINPTSVSISGGSATICIPRPRLRKLSVDTNCVPPPDYYDDDNFETSVDVKRCYIDDSDGVEFVWNHSCCDDTFSQTTQTVYAEVRDSRLSVVKLTPATYSGGVWTKDCLLLNCRPDSVVIPYWSGVQASLYTEMITASLANSLLKDIIPSMVDLCNCWKADQIVEDRNMFTPYGLTNGAIKAWLADSRAKIGQGGKF